MKKNSVLNFDKGLLLAVIGLLVLGVYVIYSGSNFRATELGHPGSYYAMKHLTFIGIGFFPMCLAVFVDHRIFHKLAQPVFLVCTVLLLAVIVCGFAAKGATRWLSIGGMSLQPAEFMKIAIFAQMSRKLSKLGDDITDLKKGYIKPLTVLLIVCGLIIKQPNLSMALMIFATIYILFFVAGVRVRYLLMSFIPVVLSVVALCLLAPYRLRRIQAFLHPEEHLNEGGYQLWSSLVSLGHGGWIGTGVGQGTQKLGFLPESYKDVAYSLLGEELGFCGTLVVLLLFGVIVYKGLMIARNARSRFSRYFAICLTTSLAFNMCFHVAVCTGLIPTTGQPLPFISYGGTNLIVSMVSVGILLNISRARTGEILDEPRSVVQDERPL